MNGRNRTEHNRVNARISRNSTKMVIDYDCTIPTCDETWTEYRWDHLPPRKAFVVCAKCAAQSWNAKMRRRALH